MASRTAVLLISQLSLMLAVSIPANGQGQHGRAELKLGVGTITVDYSPASNGPAMGARSGQVDPWSAGTTRAVTLATPVNLAFGGTRIVKGTYRLSLARLAGTVSDQLPTGRGFSDLAGLAPSARDDSRSGGLQVSGASGAENTYTMNGADITDPQTGALKKQNQLPAEMAQQVQVDGSPVVPEAVVYRLMFDPQTGQEGARRDAFKHPASVTMKQGTAPSSSEALNIELKASRNGGTLILTRGSSRLSCDFRVAE